MGGPLVLSRKALDGQRPVPTAADEVVAIDVVERHLLPRFRLARVARLASYGAGLFRRTASVEPGDNTKKRRSSSLVAWLGLAAPWTGSAIVILAALAAVGLAVTGRFDRR